MKPIASALRRLLTVFSLFIALHGVAGAVEVGNLTNTSFAQAYTYAPGTVINDVFNFELSAPSSFSAIASQIVLPTFFNISNFSLTLTIPSAGTVDFGSSLTSISTGQLFLAEGIGYSLAISGLVDGAIGGGYSVLLAAAATPLIPVPEPAHWLLLAAGLLLLAARRRRGNSAV